MKKQRTPEEIYSEYKKGLDYKNRINLFETVRQNENFFLGKQWEDTPADDLEKPVLNILGRVVSYFVSVLTNDSIGVSVDLFNTLSDSDSATVTKTIRSQLVQAIEYNKLPYMARDLVRNAAVDGDCCVHMYFDTDVPTGQRSSGLVRCEVIDNRNIIFANSAIGDKERQRYILLVSHYLLEDLKDEMEALGCKKEEIDKLKADSDIDGEARVTVICRYWKENGIVYTSRTTATATVMPPTETGYTLYPIAIMNWEKVKDSYHGSAAISGLIPNQVAINKLFAMAIKFQKELAFPKVLYDRTKISKWSNRIGAIGVNGDPNTAVARAVTVPDMSGQVLAVVDKLMAYTRDLMGASDAALGNIRPDNTSAIVAVVRTTAVPLELQKRSLYLFFEEIFHSILDIIRTDYGTRDIVVTDKYGNSTLERFNFSSLGDYIFKLKIDVGNGSFFSEEAQLSTLDALYQKGVITDAVTYLEAIPENALPGKYQLIAMLREKEGEGATQEA